MNGKTILKRTVKDSVFTDLFGQPKYLMQLYEALHPEDTGVTIDDIYDITLRNILTDDLYNDLGFRVGDRQMILVECQSTWSVNIVIRALQYLVETYNRYIEENDIYIYGSRKAVIPSPELYVIYTGNRKKCPEYISLKDEFFGETYSAIDVRVKVIVASDSSDIINQYIAFTKVVNEQIRIHGRTRMALEETIRICEDEDVLREYLESRRSEIMDIYTNLFDQGVVFDRYESFLVKEAEERGLKQAIDKLAEHYMSEKPELTPDEARELAKSILE